MRYYAGFIFIGALLLSGCGKFFVPETGNGGGSTGGGGGTSPTASLYVANASSSSPTIAGFSTTAGALAVLPNAPYTSVVLPSTLALTPSNKFIYVGGINGFIYLYSVNGDGSLSLANGGAPVASGLAPAAMAVDATGSWLLDVDTNSHPVLSVFSINATTGILTLLGSSLPLDVGAARHMVLIPNNQFLYISLGTGGVDIVSFNSTSGAVANVGHLTPQPIQGAADTGMAVDAAGSTLYLGETAGNGLRVLSIGANGVLTEKSGSPYLTGLGPTAVVVDGTGSHVYVSNRTDGNISGFSVTTAGALTPIAGSPYATGTSPVDMVADTTRGYLAVICAGGSPDLQLFSFDAATPGKLVAAASATTGTDPTVPLAIVATH